MQYDIITIGGGLGGASLAKAMAERGSRVLVIERETVFKDRVRGEALVPWGVGEAQELGLYDLLSQGCGHEVPWVDLYLGPNQIAHRNFPETTSQRMPMMNFYHPRMQETLIRAAAAAGADIRRGTTVQAIKPGKPPSVRIEINGKVEEISARLIVGADGRVSLARKWGDFTVHHDDPNFILAGIWLNDVNAPDDTSLILTNPGNGKGAYLFPQGNGCARAYAAYLASSDYRIQGSFEDFAKEFTSAGGPAEIFEGAKPNGPVASFDCADSYTPHPYKNGVALVGDAAASTDPTWGQGLCLTLRDVRVLRDCLSSTDDWDKAADDYATEHDRHYEVIHTVIQWMREIMMWPGPAADAVRAKAMPLIAADMMRVPDHIFSGPDLPFNAEVKARFYGEI